MEQSALDEIRVLLKRCKDIAEDVGEIVNTTPLETALDMADFIARRLEYYD